MRKSIVFIVVFLLITLISKAQSESYYIYDKVRILTENASIYHLQLQPGLSERQQYIIDSLVRVNSSQVIVTGNNHYIIQVDDHNAQRIKREILSCSNSILYFSKEYVSSDSCIVWTNRKILLKLKNDVLNLQDILDDAKVPYISFKQDIHSLSNYVITLAEDSAIFYAKKLYETQKFIYTEPDFFFYTSPNGYSDNTYFNQQWAINNDSININAINAWLITTGSSKVKTAVVDVGVDLDHEDLQHNIVDGYNACTLYQFSSPIENGSYEWGPEYHGTMCAGIISAENNDKGIVGIAHTSKISSIRAGYVIYLGVDYSSRSDWYPWGYDVMSYLDFIDAIDYATYIANADVICYALSLQEYSSAVEDKVSQVCDLGRNGKGVVFVISSGNTEYLLSGGQDTLNYLAKHPNVISVGAITQQGKRLQYSDNIHNLNSCYGDSLDMVAPGLNVMTTDIDDEYSNFSGTSAAAPHVAGVAALVLSVNPCLTREEVTYILESTCTKVRPDVYNYGNSPNHPNGTWNIEVGYGLVNGYEAVLLAQQMGGYVFRSQTEIQSNTLWDTASLINDDLIIDSLATLTITDTLYIAGGSRIIVRPGGKLIVNGGTLTNACDGEMWEGIIVEGDSTQRQQPNKQGAVYLTNATIEAARNAVSTRGAENNDAQWAKTGGIVQATNTLFRNNLRSADFLPYENHKATGGVASNASYFTRCTFTIDDTHLFAENNEYFLHHVTLYGVRGVKFEGCTFRNETVENVGLTRGYAIIAEEAGFFAQRVCPQVSNLDPCGCYPSGSDTVTRCSFEGFHEAVHAANSNGNYNITVDNCDFAHNRTGVTLSVADNARVSFCDFDLSDTVSYCGIELDNSTGYTVEENFFHRQYNTNAYKVTGIYVGNSGTAENVIRKNSFSNVNWGIAATGTNALNSRTRIPGLQFECNSFAGGKTDISVNSGTVRGTQGSASAGADNVFTGLWSSQSIVLSSANNITYYYSNGTNHIPNNSSTGVTPVGSATANGCASSLCGMQVNPKGTGTALAQYRALAEEYADIVETVHAPSLQPTDTMETVDPQDAETVALQSRLSDLSAAMGDLARTEIRAILSDTVVDMALLKEWYETIVETMYTSSLQTEQSTDLPVAAYQLSEVYSTEGDYAADNALLASLPQRFHPDEAARNEYANYLNLQRLRENVSGNWYRQTDTEIADLQRVAEYDNGRAARMAKEILCFFHHICYEDEPILPELADGTIGERNARRDGARPVSTTTGTLTLHPNPAHNTLTVESTSVLREITVYDMAGHAVMVRANNDSPQRWDINVASLHAGIYLLKVVTETGIETAKFVKN